MSGSSAVLGRRGAALLIAISTLVASTARAQVQSGFGTAAGGGVASSKESYKTDLFTGGASLTIPIVVPPGTNGTEPHLALTYSSSTGMTWIGQGWDFRFPSVRRMTKFGIPKYTDDPLAGDRFEIGDDQLVRDDTGNYRFTRDNLDRIQRNDDGSGHVVSWTLNRRDGARLEFGTDAQHRVTTPSGQVFEWLLAREVDSNGNFVEYTYVDRTANELVVDSVPYPKRISWSFRGDTAGSATIRTVDFIMQDRPDHSVSYRGAVHERMFHRLDRINVSAGGTLVTAYDVKYLDESGEGAQPSNRRSLVHRVVRLGADNATALPADQYTYAGFTGTWTSNSTIASNLAALRLPGLTSDDSATATEFDLKKINLGDGDTFRLLDVNGDAVPDIVGTGLVSEDQRGTFTNDGTAAMFPDTRPPRPDVLAYTPLIGWSGGQIGMPTAIASQTLIPMGTRTADLDGDGKPDLLIGASDVTNNPSIFDNFYVALFNTGFDWELGTSVDSASGYNTPPAKMAVYQASCWGASPRRPILIGWTELVDVNGDGKADLLEHRTPGSLSNCATNGKAAWTVRNVYLNNGNGWGATPDPVWSAAFSAAITKLNVFVYQLLPVDVNGDGLIDFMADSQPSLCPGTCTNDGIPGTTSNGQSIADFARGSDGKADPDPNNSSNAIVLINTGAGWATSTVDPDVSVPANFRPIDINGDGLVDNATATPQLNTGVGFVNAPFTLPSGYDSSAGGRVIVDLDGDGQVDMVRADGTNYEVLLAPSDAPPGLLTHEDLVTGGTIDLKYTASSEGTCFDDFDGGGCHERLVPWPTQPDGSYRHGNDIRCVFPMTPPVDGTDRCQIVFQDLPFPVQTVTRITTDDHNGNVAISEAEYNHGRYNNALEATKDREFRGFGLTSKYGPTINYTDPKSSQAVHFATLEETQFYQEAYLRGESARTARYQLDDPNVLANRVSRSRVLDISVPTFGLAAAGAGNWFIFDVSFNGTSCDPSTAISCPVPPGFTSRADYIALGAGLPDPNQPYQDFLAAFANTSNRDRNDAYLVLPIAMRSRKFDDPTQATLHTDFRSFQWHDKAGNPKYAWDMGATRYDDTTGAVTDLSPADDRITLTTYALPQASGPPNLRDHPSYLARKGFDSGGALVTLAETWFSYDGAANGQVVAGNMTLKTESLVDPANSLNTTVSTVLTYDAGTSYGLPRTVSDPFEINATAYTTTYSYDASNTFSTSIQRGSLARTLSYSVAPPAPRGLGLIYTDTNSNAETLTFGYDTFGRTTSRSGSGAVGAVRTTSYHDYFGWNASQSRRTETLSDGSTPVATDVFLDGVGRAARTLRAAKRPDSGAAAAIEQTQSYDLRGNVSAVSRARFCAPGGASCDTSLGATSFYHDPRDRLVFVKQADGGVGVHRYETRIDPGRTDPERFEVSIDAAGRRRDYRLDGADDVAQMIEYESASNYTAGIYRTNYLYDALGRLQLLCDPLASSCAVAGRDPKHTTLLTYDTLSRLTRRDDPDRGTWTYRFRGDAALLRQTDGNGVATAFGYDSVYGRRKTVDWAANGSQDVTYTYGDELGASAPSNSQGRLARTVGPASTVDLSYDTAGRVNLRKRTLAGTGEQYTESFGYDWEDRITSRTYPDNETITHSYDVMGLNRISSAARTYLDRLDFDADLEPTTYVFGNGETRTRGYQPSTGYLSSIVDGKSGQPAVLNRSYTYDPTGFVSSVTDTTTPSESLSGIGYDGLGRLIGATRAGQSLVYGYDVVNNLVSKEGTPIPFQNTSKPHAPTNSAQYQTDAAGNLTMKNGRVFGFDPRNRLSSVSGTNPITYQYDDATERVVKTVGADRSVFLDQDVEIMNRVRLIKTIRANGEIIARIETVLAGGQGARVTPFAPGTSGRWPTDEQMALLLLLGFAGLAGALQQGSRAGLPARAAASSLAMLLALLPVVARSANATIKGDVNNDGRVDSGDVLLLTRHVNNGVVLPVDPSVGDVAPFSISGTLGDGTRNAGDIIVLQRSISEPDLDGDGLPPSVEAQIGTSPLLADTDGNGTSDRNEDSDHDGVANFQELLNGTNPASADTDGDGIVDSRDANPTVFDGDRTVWVHTDHLGSVAVMTNSAGTAIRTISYDVWGSVRSNAPQGGVASLDSAEKFTGQRFDEETQLAYYGARYYDPGLGRFMTADAHIERNYRSSALQPYAYVRNSPLSFIDPSGNFIASPPEGSPGGSNGWPDRGPSPRQDIGSSLNGMVDDAINRTIAELARTPKLAKSGPSQPVVHNTQALYTACRSGSASSCYGLQIQNEQDLKEVLEFLRKEYPDLVERAGNPTIAWDDDNSMAADELGETSYLSGNITISRSYESEADLVNTVSHELDHSGDGVAGRTISGAQDLASPLSSTGGARHTQIYLDGTMRGNDFWTRFRR